ncbi:MAG: hypothetical protein UR94_C0033G0011 [Parcubacteria group bacterium GW2011_GWA2_36_10]|nr:MAG: hypothetical protein UR94_C0033G0011 [Parcubacteria group bacterium GW2011_GWA2_36_10]
MEAMLGRIVQKLVHLSAEMLGTMYDLMERLAGSDGNTWLAGLKKFLRGELVARWRIGDDGIIYSSVKSCSISTSGSDWLKNLKRRRFTIDGVAPEILRSKNFQASPDGTYEIAIFRGSLLAECERSSNKIRIRASHCHFFTPGTDLACLIRDNFSDEEIRAMGLKRIIVMHQPIYDSHGIPSLLALGCDGAGRWLSAYHQTDRDDWGREEEGFAFVVFFNSEQY